MVLPSAAPHLTTQPNPAIAYVGQTHTFSVQSDKPQNVNYVWWKNGAMRGPGTSELVLANLTSQDSGWYRVMASNSSGTVVSDSVYLEVREGQPTGAEENPETLPSAPMKKTSEQPRFTGPHRLCAPMVRLCNPVTLKAIESIKAVKVGLVSLPSGQ